MTLSCNSRNCHAPGFWLRAGAQCVCYALDLCSTSSGYVRLQEKHRTTPPIHGFNCMTCMTGLESVMQNCHAHFYRALEKRFARYIFYFLFIWIALDLSFPTVPGSSSGKYRAR